MSTQKKMKVKAEKGGEVQGKKEGEEGNNQKDEAKRNNQNTHAI
jgi:hypothetical protein